jgi:alpha-ketoglutaric semialdehyde dehydrogenase
MIRIHGKNFIGNQLHGESSVTFQAVDPSNGNELEGIFYEATPGEVAEAVESAGRAFSIYRNKTGKEKALFLETIASEILHLGDALIARCCAETGLPEGRITGERGRTMGQLKLFAQVLKEGSWVDARIEHAIPARMPVPKPDVRSMLKALGPAGIFGAGNFPLAFSVAGGDTASALAAGCPVVVKAHPAHPGTCELVAGAIIKAANKCDVPEGVFSMVHGRSADVGLAIVNHPLIQAIGFTGSHKGGKAIYDAAARRPVPIPVYAEMGSVNPVFILSESMASKYEEIASGFVGSVTLGTGQFCTNPGLIIHERSEAANKFRLLVKEQVEKLDASTMLTRDIQNAYRGGLSRLESQQGVQVLARGKDDQKGFKGTPEIVSVDSGTFIANKDLQQEVFGPSSVSVEAKTKDEFEEIARNLEGHLTASLFATEEDLKNHSELVSILEQKVGRIIVNAFPTGVEVCHAMVHGGPFPATTDSRSTSVGTGAILRFARPVCYQGFPEEMLPDELKNSNPLNIWRMVDGERTQ